MVPNHPQVLNSAKATSHPQADLDFGLFAKPVNEPLELCASVSLSQLLRHFQLTTATESCFHLDEQCEHQRIHRTLDSPLAIEADLIHIRQKCLLS